MKAITVDPGSPGSLALSDTDEPATAGALSVRAIAIGVCGTDHEIIAGGHGAPPPGTDRLILGHESLGRVIDAPDGCGFTRGDLVVGIVRRPDPEPCAACASGQWDMCLNGGFTERGISGRDGYGSEVYTLEPDFAVAVDAGLGLRGVLVEPTSIVTKAWRKVDELARLNTRPLASVLVTGAGPVGLLAAMLGRQRGLDVHVLDRVPSGPKPALVRRLGATYHQTLDPCPPTDAVLECTGSPALVPEVIGATNRNAVVCLAGVSEPASETVDVGSLNRELVLENDIVFGSVNANAADYRRAVQHLVDADASWLDDVITRRVPLSRWREAYERRDGDVKTVMLFDGEI